MILFAGIWKNHRMRAYVQVSMCRDALISDTWAGEAPALQFRYMAASSKTCFDRSSNASTISWGIRFRHRGRSSGPFRQ